MPSVDTVIKILLNGVSLSVLYFLIATGLTLIFGLMGVINFAHGALALLGGYIAVSVIGLLSGAIGPNTFLISIVAAPLVVAGIGIAIEYVTLRPLYDEDVFLQVLLTFGITLIISESILLVWGRTPRSLALSVRQGSVDRSAEIGLLVGAYLNTAQSASAVKLRVRRSRVRVIHARNRPPQRQYRLDRRRFC
jgi:branched-subunit amino acid ABC-type transport system permease component